MIAENQIDLRLQFRESKKLAPGIVGISYWACFGLVN
jgi:hypothetical protein